MRDINHTRFGMLSRSLKLPVQQSFFLFGPRNTGKSTLLAASYAKSDCLWFNLLDPELEDRFAREPQALRALVEATSDEVLYIVLDEIQKLPKLLDVVHWLLESTNKYFIMSGSSARKLKRDGANLLAG